MNVQRTLDKINFQVKDYVSVNLIGDRGYITKEKFTFSNRQLPIITPKRKNQKNKIITPKEQRLLNDRHKIENVFATNNKNIRVMVRKDKKLKNYLSFVYMSMLEMHVSYALTNDLEKYLA